MSVLTSLFKNAGSGAGEVLASPLEALGNVFDKIFTSDAERAQAEAIMEKLRQQPALFQSEITKLEAQHRSVFVAGWRPALGWVCALSLATYYIPQHVLAAVLWVDRVWATGGMMPYPIGNDSLLELIFALLGLGAMRSAEKFGRVTK